VEGSPARGGLGLEKQRVAQSSAFSNSAVLPITRAAQSCTGRCRAEFLRCGTLRYLLLIDLLI
jgi:hypothetical protein